MNKSNLPTLGQDLVRMLIMYTERNSGFTSHEAGGRHKKTDSYCYPAGLVWTYLKKAEVNVP